MKYLFFIVVILLSSCISFNKAPNNKPKKLNKPAEINISFSDIDTNNDKNITISEFKKYKESTQKQFSSPNIDYKTPLYISLIILASIIFLCFLPKICEITKRCIDFLTKKVIEFINSKK
jgi:hypothetical protein